MLEHTSISTSMSSIANEAVGRHVLEEATGAVSAVSRFSQLFTFPVFNFFQCFRFPVFFRTASRQVNRGIGMG